MTEYVCTVAADALDAARDLAAEDQARVFRWALRGLPMPLAVRKVRTDLEDRPERHRRFYNPGDPG